MILRFDEFDSQQDDYLQVGTVELRGGELVGDEALVDIVEHRMRRDEVAAAAAMQSLDGWSNGYLRSRLLE